MRVCTQKYQPLEKNMGDVRMHLTNYSINKNSEAFVQPEDETDCSDAHKRTVSSLMRTLAEDGHDVEKLWEQIGQVCVKTIISVQPHLEHTYFTCRGRSEDAGSGCFELLGFDIMMDHKLRPFLLEVNHSPSFTCDSPLDLTVKSAVLKATMELISFSKDEHRLLRRPARLTPEVRDRLVTMRNEYELENADRLEFDTLYPPNAATCGGDSDAAEVLHGQYDTYLSISQQLYDNMSVGGSRRQAVTCGSIRSPQAIASARITSDKSRVGSFHAAIAAAVFKEAKTAGLKAGADVLKAIRSPPSGEAKSEGPKLEGKLNGAVAPKGKRTLSRASSASSSSTHASSSSYASPRGPARPTGSAGTAASGSLSGRRAPSPLRANLPTSLPPAKPAGRPPSPKGRPPSPAPRASSPAARRKSGVGSPKKKKAAKARAVGGTQMHGVAIY